MTKGRTQKNHILYLQLYSAFNVRKLASIDACSCFFCTLTSSQQHWHWPRAGHKVRWSVEALKRWGPLKRYTTDQRLFFHGKKPTLTVQRLMLKQIMHSALKFVFFWVHINGTTLIFFSWHLNPTEQRLIICLNLTTTQRQGIRRGARPCGESRVVDPYSFFTDPDPDPELDVGGQYGSKSGSGSGSRSNTDPGLW